MQATVCCPQRYADRTKIRVHRTLIRPVLLCGQVDVGIVCECGHKRKIIVLESKALRKIFAPRMKMEIGESGVTGKLGYVPES